MTAHEIRQFKTMTLDLCCKAVEIGDVRHRLTYSEFAIVELLTRRPGALFSRQRIMDAMYGEGAGNFTERTVDSHIKRIRAQGITGIICHYRTGYCWEDRVTERSGKPGASPREKTAAAVISPRCCAHCGAPIP